MRVSTGLRNHKLITGSVKTGLDGGVIRIYGSLVSRADALTLVPASADDSVGAATLLATISNNGAGTGINFATSAATGVLAKATGETWQGDYVATGYPSFARFSSLTDDGSLSTTEKRIQQTVGVTDSEIIISSEQKTLGETQRLDSYYLAEPAGS